MFVACRSCAKSRGNEVGVGGGRRGVASCDLLCTHIIVLVSIYNTQNWTYIPQTFPSLNYSKHSKDYSRRRPFGLEGLRRFVSRQDRKYHTVASLEQLQKTIAVVLEAVNYSTIRSRGRRQVFLLQVDWNLAYLVMMIGFQKA